MFERNRILNRLLTHGQAFWRKRIEVSSAIVCVSVMVWMTLRFTAALNWVVEMVVASESGTEAEVDGAHWDGWGNLTIERIVLKAPRWPGRAGELAVVQGLDVTIEPLRLLLGQIWVRGLHVDSASLNIAERQNAHGIFNLMALQPKVGSGRSPIRLQQAQLDHLDIVSLTVDPRDAVVLEGQHSFAGWVRPAAAAPSALDFELSELVQGQPPRPGSHLLMKGSWNEDTFAYRMEVRGLSFVESLLPMLPYQFDQAWKKINLTGSIDLIEIVGQPNHPIDQATLRVRNVEANILFPGYEREWVRYEPALITQATPGAAPASATPEGRRLKTGLPRMKVESGTVTFARNTLSFDDFKGTLASTRERSLPLPLQLDIAITLPTEDQPTSIEDAAGWLEDAINRSGLQARLRIPHFAMTRDALQRYDGVELPGPAAQVLTNLQARTWDIDLDVHASRSIAAKDASGAFQPQPLTTKGTLELRDGSGGYFLFPYMMTDVAARLELNNEVVTIASLDGRGSGGAPIHIEGTVTEPGDDAGVDLRITAEDVPIDDALKNSFLYGPRKVFPLLYDQSARNRLCDAGLLRPDEFTFGGRCGVHLRVARAVRGGSVVKTTGDIQVRDANVVCSRFPYPLHVARGEIQVEDEAITLPTGSWAMTTRTGAPVSIDGVIRIPRVGEERQVFPDLKIRFENDRVNPLLLASIPFDPSVAGGPSDPGWPGRTLSPAARMLRQIGLQGALKGGGSIGADPRDERTTWDFDLFLADGSITPQASPAPPSNPEEQILPCGMNLTGVQAHAKVTDQSAALLSLEGDIGAGRVQARGYASTRTPFRWFSATGQRVPIDRWVFGFLPADKVDAAMLTWGGCHPQGTIDADVHLESRDSGATRRHVLVDPTNVRLALEGDDASVAIPCGYLELVDDALHVHDMQLDFVERRLPLDLADLPPAAADALRGSGADSVTIGQLTANGTALYGPGDATDENLIRLEAHLDCVHPAFFGVLPADVRERLERIQLSGEGAFQLTRGEFRGPAGGFGPQFSADLTLENAQFTCGPRLRGVNASLRVRSDEGGPVNGLRMDIDRGSLLMQDRAVTDIHGSLLTHTLSGDLNIPRLEGAFYGGRIWLEASVKGAGTRPWQAELGVTGSNLPEVIAGPKATAVDRDSDGRVNARISLGGEIDGDRPREGRGKIMGYDAKLGDLPMAMRLLQVTQLMPPLSQSIEVAKIDFYLRDHRVRFEKFELSCPTLSLLGSGSLDLDSWTISMRFKNRGIIPVASDVLGAATDLLLAIDVEGPISDPTISAKALPAFGNNPSLERHDAPSGASPKTASP